MKTTLAERPERSVSAIAWRPEPFLHIGPGKVYNPLTDAEIREGEPGYAELRSMLGGGQEPAALPAEVGGPLAQAGWLIEVPEEEIDRRYRLKYVAIETHTVCNQACYFCPVSVAPREADFMPTELFEGIVAQLIPHRETLEGVFLMSYNEPTLDQRFVSQCQAIQAAGLPPAVNTNASGLTPEKVDAILSGAPLRYLSVNLSTVDRERYRKDRGKDQLPQVLRNLDYMRDKEVAEEMVIVVLGEGDEGHARELDAITERFAGSRFTVRRERIMDRAGYLPVGLRARHRTLCGCENVGSRPLHHLHVTPQGRCVLCCEDYDEKYVVGDLNQSSLEEILAGDALALYRRWIYGLEEAPEDFMCRKCIFARFRR